MAAPSSPASRSPSRALCCSSTENARPMASSDASRTAIQKSPGATRARMPRSGSSAKAKSRTTIRPNGRICAIATRDRDSIRRSLPATSPASRQRLMAARSRLRSAWSTRSASASRVCPDSTRTSRVASARARSSSCDAITTVRPSAGAAATISCRTSRPSASSPACGSSRSSSFGSRTSAPPRARRRRWPAESLRWVRSATAPRPRRSMVGSGSSSRPAARVTNRRFSRTVRSS